MVSDGLTGFEVDPFNPQRLHQSRSVGGAQPGAGIPTRVRLVLVQRAVDVVIALHDVMEQIGRMIEEWIDESGRFFALTKQPLIDSRINPAHKGATALVPPMTVFRPPTRT